MARPMTFSPGLNAAPLHALVADASAEDRRAIADALQKAAPGIVIREACDGKGVLDQLAGQRPDLVLISRTLPQVDGKALLDWVRGAGRDSMFVLVSDRLVPRWPAIATQISAYEVLLKPFREGPTAAIVNDYRRMQECGRLLLVEPTESVRNVVRKMLERSRFKFVVSEIDQGRHALELAQINAYDVVLVAIELPDMSGLKAAAQLAAGKAAPAIIVTGAQAHETLRASCGKIGASYLDRPFEPHDLENALHEAFGLWRPYLLNAAVQAA